MKALDIAKLPLTGSHLIEASAGTGKTYTLSHLYLRLIIERELNVDQILVVTFTRAAVQELRTRLRQIIVDARLALSEPEKADAAVADLVQPYLGEGDAQLLKDRLEQAQLSMDQASISTIHTFCTQLLSDNAFESGQLFDMQVEDRDDDLRLQAVQEYWRSNFVHLNDSEADWIRAEFKSPEHLLGQIKEFISPNPPRILPTGSREDLKKLSARAQKLWQRFLETWNQQGAELTATVCQSKALSGVKVKAKSVEKTAAMIDELCQLESMPSNMGKDFRFFSQDFLDTACKKGQLAPQEEFFGLLDLLAAALEQLTPLRKSVELRVCAHYTHQWLREQKSKLRLLSYDDLLIHAGDALGSEDSDALIARLRQKYPAALIDEFQDTDPRQYGIFSRIYAEQDELAWYMIGDPKQAIYSFRGADIHTYLSAAKACKNQHTLGTNWRSTSAMVAAVNALFSEVKRPFGRIGDINFNPVEASSRANSKLLQLSGEEQPALCLALLDNDTGKVLGKGVAGAQAADLAARLIAEQIQQGKSGELVLGERALQAADIAVLVRSNKQANAMRRALARRGIASVVTGNNSIFATAEAANMRRVLQALAEPTVERVVAPVLASDLCGFSVEELIYLQSADRQWLHHSEHFAYFSHLLRRQGVLAAVLSLMGQYSTASRLRSAVGGERSLSNYIQLGELLQDAWQERPELDSLQVWLDRQCEHSESGGDAAQLRLETDERLVQIVTVHKSKGLEYPVVYLPFVWDGRSPKSGDLVKFHDGQQNCIDLGSESIDNHREQMQEESLAEELRLLYVALTRSSTQCTVLWGDVSEASYTALAWLQSQYEQKVEVGFSDNLTGWVSQLPQGKLLAAATEVRHIDIDEQPALSALLCAKPPRPSWQISSYSALVRSISHHVELPDYDSGDATPVAAEVPETDLDSIMFFPRGAQAGTFLHHIFEYTDFSRADGPELDSLIRDSLAAHGFAEHWFTAVKTMLLESLKAPLYPVVNLSMSMLRPEDRLNEMGFHFPVPQLRCEALLAILRQHKVLSADEWLDFETVKGYMTGFVDLIFRFEERYYVLDYKSNHLGYHAADYHKSALDSAMREHRYDLQYLMYTVALHRYLATRLSDYNYETHMGGSFYLFLRGMRIDDDSAPGVYYDKPPLALIEDLDQLFAAKAGHA